MNYNPRTNIHHIILSLLFFLYFITSMPPLYAQEKTVIKVGYPIVQGFTDKKGELYTGYVYDYLREISIYTGWEYEFIEMDLTTSMEALLKGEIDLLAGMLKNEQTMALFDFPELDIGSTYTTLSTLKDNDYSEDLGHIILDDMRIGYYETSQSRLAGFMDFCERNGTEDIQLVPYPVNPDREVLVEKLKSQEVDLLLGNDLSIADEEKVIARFGPTRHFLATTKGNTTIVKALDTAIARIRKRNPDFEEALYTKYFEHDYYSNLILSTAQRDYLKSLSPIRAVYISNYIPLQYYDEVTKEAKGDFINVAKLLEMRLGITFEFIPVQNYKEACEMLRENQADIIVGVVDDYLIADQYDFTLTPHYLKSELTKVVHKGTSTSNAIKSLVLPKGRDFLPIEEGYEIIYYDTIEECLKAVDNGEAYATYISVNSLSHYLANGDYNHLAVLPGTSYEVGISFALSNHLDAELIDIFCKAVYYLPYDRLLEVAEDYTFQIKQTFNLRTFITKHLTLCLGILCTLLVLMGIYIQLLIRKTLIDPLTKVYNRGACERMVSKYAGSQKRTGYIGFVIIDIDHFKQVNDRFGHKMGDALLIEFSKLLKKLLPRQAVSFRLGGDEFIILVKNINPESIYLIDDQLDFLCHTMHREITYNGQSQEVSLSVGAVITNQTMTFNEIYAAADELLYEIKRSGRNGFKSKLLEAKTYNNRRQCIEC